MRFSVTSRTIDESARDAILDGGRAQLQARRAGPKFIVTRDTIRDVVDDAEAGSSDDDDDDDLDEEASRPASSRAVSKKKPAPRKKPGPGSNPNSGRSSPVGTRRVPGAASMLWSAEDGARLME